MNLIPKASKLNYERIKVAFGIRDTDKWERTGQYLILIQCLYFTKRRMGCNHLVVKVIIASS